MLEFACYVAVNESESDSPAASILSSEDDPYDPSRNDEFVPMNQWWDAEERIKDAENVYYVTSRCRTMTLAGLRGTFHNFRLWQMIRLN